MSRDDSGRRSWLCREEREEFGTGVVALFKERFIEGFKELN